jgi:hypothetical protein
MVAINIKYTEEELAPKSQIFYCGSGLVKCQIVSSEKAVSRFATAENVKPEVLKVHYAVADGEYKGAENTIEFDLWDDSVVDFGGGKSAPRSKLAAQNFVALCVGAGFDSYVANSDLLNGKLLLVNHEIRKGEVIEEIDDIGNKVAKLDEQGNEQHYPDRSEVAKKGKKFARIDSAKLVAAVGAPVAPAQLQAPVAVVAPIAAPVTYAPPPAAAMPLVDDEIPW